MVMKTCNLVEIVRTTVEDIHYFAAGRKITLHVPEQEVVPIIADADRIGQVVNNYLTNALKYSPAERPVEVSLTIEGKMARVAVHDEGPGLSPEDQKLVWERFYRAKEVEVQYGSGPGLGLGLYICRTIIESHHGQVGLTSEEGKGSTFWFTLPLST
jgi:signal transduction histidine kinase